jgi:hypothetical protein
VHGCDRDGHRRHQWHGDHPGAESEQQQHSATHFGRRGEDCHEQRCRQPQAPVSVAEPLYHSIETRRLVHPGHPEDRREIEAQCQGSQEIDAFAQV